MSTPAKCIETIAAIPVVIEPVVTEPVVIEPVAIEPVKRRHKIAVIGFLILCLMILAVAVWIGSPQ